MYLQRLSQTTAYAAGCYRVDSQCYTRHIRLSWMGRFVLASNDVRRVTHRSARAYYVVLLSITQHLYSEAGREGRKN